ncbi:hypothetical protein JTE90_027909 [Oedothorax gibbosus]|uniref:Uncharacterized protein n=1 Tax=Oedothorax gibbosus TaxID=931172 RepID=A0AAV6UC97_9ARAC|nr:hypothetical protein JTE90_027909 [Oedothorax gibbosus]
MFPTSVPQEENHVLQKIPQEDLFVLGVDMEDCFLWPEIRSPKPYEIKSPQNQRRALNTVDIAANLGPELQKGISEK